MGDWRTYVPRDIWCERNWAAPCKALFERIAETDHGALLTWINEGDIPPGQMTIALEVAGEHAAAIPTLLRHLKDPSSMVREGAVLGLRQWISVSRVSEELLRVAEEDESNAVRETAEEVWSGGSLDSFL